MKMEVSQEAIEDEVHNEQDNSFILERSKNLFEIKKIKKKSDSEVWKHFGQIVHKSGNIITDKRYTDKFFCIHCFENAKEQNPKFKG